MEYDTIAHWYDILYEWWDFQAEDNELGALIWKVQWSVLDLGCGTGQWIHIINPEPAQYLGIDPSGKMLSCARNRFPTYAFLEWNIDRYTWDERAEILTWLFGVMNYLTNDEVEKALRIWESVFLMDYIDGYHPMNYAESERPERQFSPISFGQLYQWVLFENYNIYTNREVSL